MSRAETVFGRLIAMFGPARDQNDDDDSYDGFEDYSPNSHEERVDRQGSTALPMVVASHQRIWSPSAQDRALEAFDVSQPVATSHDLRGRDAEIRRLLSGVLFRRTHAIVSGPRGSGKTSLVRVFGDYADGEGVVVLYTACDTATTFGELMRDFLRRVPAFATDPESADAFADRVAQVSDESTPHEATSILTLLKYSQIVMIVDEFDRVQDPAFRGNMASLIKLISDARVPVRFILVGGSNIFEAIVGDHPSLMRHVTRLGTDPLKTNAVHEILDNCARTCDTHFTEEAKELLTEVVCGSPYHTRLFGMHSVLAALGRASNEVSRDDVLEGLRNGFDEWAMLNTEDADVFRGLLANGDVHSKAYVALARRVAGRAGNGTAQPEGDPAITDEQKVARDLQPAVEKSDAGLAFRDATAPQFLIALEQFYKGQKAHGRSERNSRV